jgi:hypothetical protein
MPTDSSPPEGGAAGASNPGPADPRYLATVERMLRGQAYRERGAAELFAAGLALVPAAGAGWSRVIARHVEEERAHYTAVAALWSRTFARPARELDDWVSRRLRDRPFPALTSWLELAMVQFLFDRAGTWQLSEYVDSSFAPYRALARAIVADERGHQDAGARLVVQLCAAPGADPVAAQAAFATWLRVALLSFGRPGGPGNTYAIAAGLKRRDSAAIARDFLADIAPTARAANLTLPG